MYGYFTFEVQPPDESIRTMVLFCATSAPSADAVIAAVRKYGENALSPDRIVLVGIDSERSPIENIAQDERLRDALGTHIRQVASPLIHVALIPRSGLDDDYQIDGLKWKVVRAAGLTTIFRRRNALLIAPPTHHFEKPSSRHCDRFIRTANALVDGAEITFIAACCLRFIPPSVQHFYCDTGAISVVAFAIDSLRRRFDHQIIPATVDTFESYDGLKSFVFRHCDESIVLISASTSGGLESEICSTEKRFRPGQIITIFSVRARNNGTHSLLELSEREEVRESVGDLKSYEHAECPLCVRGSIAVPMMGDQFIPVRSETKRVLPMKKHSPSWLPRILESMAGRNILRAFYRSPNSAHATNDVFIDLERAFSEKWDSDFLKRLDRLILQNVPAHVTRIIHLDDPASMSLANTIKTRLNENGLDTNPEVVPAGKTGELESLNRGACLVVAAAVASGQSLLAVSRSLRSLQSNRAITYLVALTRTDLAKHIEKIENDVRMGEFSKDYGYSVVEQLYLPIVGRFARSSWDEELGILQEWANTAEGELQVCLEARIEILRAAQSAVTRGLSDDLFWPTKRSVKMALSPGFVFFPKSTPKEVFQGDVYFTVVSVLHHLRTDGPKPELRQTEYERRVLSPLCFDRFNDGVIQASFLRGAVRPELDYSDSPDDSELMTTVLRSILSAGGTPKGEASREFMLALVLGRMVLVNRNLVALHAEFSATTDDVLVRRMWEHIAKTTIGPIPTHKRSSSSKSSSESGPEAVELET